MGDLDLTILMPCLNEAETLAFCVRQAAAAIAASGVRGEVVVADNGSTDGSQEIARAEGARLVDVPTRGYGAALIGGIAPRSISPAKRLPITRSYPSSSLGRKRGRCSKW